MWVLSLLSLILFGAFLFGLIFRRYTTFHLAKEKFSLKTCLAFSLRLLTLQLWIPFDNAFSESVQFQDITIFYQIPIFKCRFNSQSFLNSLQSNVNEELTLSFQEFFNAKPQCILTQADLKKLPTLISVWRFSIHSHMSLIELISVRHYERLFIEEPNKLIFTSFESILFEVKNWQQPLQWLEFRNILSESNSNPVSLLLKVEGLVELVKAKAGVSKLHYTCREEDTWCSALIWESLISLILKESHRLTHERFLPPLQSWTCFTCSMWKFYKPP